MQTLRTAYYATLINDGTGLTGTATIRIAPAAKEWRITSVNVACSSNVYESKASVYERVIGQQYQTDLSNSGSSGDTSDTVHYLHDGDCLFVRWTGGDIGAQATLIVIAEEYLPGEGGF